MCVCVCVCEAGGLSSVKALSELLSAFLESNQGRTFRGGDSLKGGAVRVLGDTLVQTNTFILAFDLGQTSCADHTSKGNPN